MSLDFGTVLVAYEYASKERRDSDRNFGWMIDRQGVYWRAQNVRGTLRPLGNDERFWYQNGYQRVTHIEPERILAIERLIAGAGLKSEQFLPSNPTSRGIATRLIVRCGGDLSVVEVDDGASDVIDSFVGELLKLVMPDLAARIS